MGAFLKFILICFCIYFIFSRLGGFILRGLLWFIGSHAVKKQSSNYENTASKKENKKEGDIKIAYIPETKKGKTEGIKYGDYVDYEEVK